MHLEATPDLIPVYSPSQEPGLRLTSNEVTDLQANGLRHLGFEITSACPLRCGHCFARPVHDSDAGTINLERVASFAGEMGALHACGVRNVSFTGGEPLLYPVQLSVLSRAAAESGISVSVVTACHWASSLETARRVVKSLPHVDTWHLSTDEFHTVFVPLNRVVWAADAAVSLGRSVVVRMVANRPITDAHRRLYDDVRARLPAGVPIAVQGLIGSAPRDASSQDAAPVRLCIPCGPLIRHDGTLAPCCSTLANRRHAHPFASGRRSFNGIVSAYVTWLSDPLLRLIQSAGFAPVLDWANEVNPRTASEAAAATDACDCCVLLWNDPQMREAIARRAARNSARIEELFHSTFCDAPRIDRE